MTDADFISSVPDTERIQCTNCRFQNSITWEGETILIPAGNNCKKYRKGLAEKPKGILFRVYDVSKHERECDGEYRICEYFKPLRLRQERFKPEYVKWCEFKNAFLEVIPGYSERLIKMQFEYQLKKNRKKNFVKIGRERGQETLECYKALNRIKQGCHI